MVFSRVGRKVHGVIAFTLIGLASIANAAEPCVTVRTEARYRGYGYDHLVHLSNGCESAAVCTVATDVNPEPQTVSVPPRSTETVLTFMASPARTFSAKVECRDAPRE